MSKPSRTIREWATGLAASQRLEGYSAEQRRGMAFQESILLDAAIECDKYEAKVDDLIRECLRLYISPAAAHFLCKKIHAVTDGET
jgi:hypothetical protein